MEKSSKSGLDESKFDFITYKKLVVFGDSKVGKSCFLSRLENNTFLEENENDSKIYYLIK